MRYKYLLLSILIFACWLLISLILNILRDSRSFTIYWVGMIPLLILFGIAGKKDAQEEVEFIKNG